jgi:abortive infection bacteriophage resistance protein
MEYLKPAIPLEEQVEKLVERGLIVNDIDRALHYLSNISYYRLRAYTYPYQDNNHPNQIFKEEVDFDTIITLYVFDRRLRILIFDALEKIEIAFRTKIIHTWALTSGSHWHENNLLFRDRRRFEKDNYKLIEEINRSTETFIKHYFQKYSNPPNPPAWMSLEVTSLGLLSKIFYNLKKGEEKKKVTREFGLTNPKILESWLHSFSHVRNICAHHGRLWNRRFTAMPILPHNTVNGFVQNLDIFPNKLYAQLVCMVYILDIISPSHNFREKITKLIFECDVIDTHEMGFPENWDKDRFWKSDNS